MNIDEYDYDLYIDKYYNPDAINYDEETFFDVLVNCALLSIQSILPILSRLICTNLCFGVLTSVFSDKLPQQLFHSLSGICGIYLVLTLSSAQGKVMILLLFGLSYICIKFTVIIQRFIRPMLYPYLSSSNLVKCALIAFSILCQHKFLDQETWMEIRGIVMIFL